MNKFLKDLENELFKLKVSPKEIKEILEDHKEMIEVAKTEGLSDEELSKKFGDPIKVAKELYSDIKTEPKMSFESTSTESCVSYKTNEYNLVKAFSEIDGAITFEANLVSDDLQYATYDGNEIQVYEQNIMNLDDYEIAFTDNTLVLKRKKELKIFRNKEVSGEFLILIPSTITHERVEFNDVSGDANFNGVVTEKLILKLTNGDIELTNIEAGDSKFSFVNGDVEILNLRGNTIDVSVINGDLEINEGIFAGDLFFNTVSGDIELTNVECVSADLRTISGDLVGTEFYPKEVSLSSVSGDIEINNQDKAREIHVNRKKSISGTIKIN
ncbi:MAG: DUF4097 family beta strand repeat protein [Bacilli bacterium]|nr:DUF4097 family beta strand repeat protein [Bacilli bacterium]